MRIMPYRSRKAAASATWTICGRSACCVIAASRLSYGAVCGNRPHHFRSYDGFADVTLRVLGNVRDQATQRCGKLFTSDVAWLGPGTYVQRACPSLRRLKPRLELCQKLVSRGAGIHLRFHIGDLLLRELSADCINHQPLDAAAGVPDVKSDRAESEWALP